MEHSREGMRIARGLGRSPWPQNAKLVEIVGRKPSASVVPFLISITYSTERGLARTSSSQEESPTASPGVCLRNLTRSAPDAVVTSNKLICRISPGEREQKMWSRTRKTIVWVAVSVLGLVAASAAWYFSGSGNESAREQLLRFVPADATSVVFVDLNQLRSSPFFGKLNAWAPRVAQDSEYAQFVRDTGFNYEQDLSKLFIALSNHGADSKIVALAEGKFDRAKIESFLNRSGKADSRGSLKFYRLAPSANDRPFLIALLSSRLVAITNSENAFAEWNARPRQADRAEWEKRFERLAGSPAFAVIRQDSAVRAAATSAAPGGFRSPQLAGLLDQLQWISIVGKPDNGVLRVVVEGECPSETVASQLRDFLQGIQLLAQNGLNDPKLRQQMNPEEREAYLELLKSADVEKLDRGETKSVRLVLTVTPQFLEVARVLAAQPAPATTGDPPVKSAKGAGGSSRKKSARQPPSPRL